ncbi:respiratory chain complex I subunit 1 family protein [Trichloromonas sp.]|uniref:respiratory chain complex I subunit 1 family protein n=1 Tax=Trichloromonas sp. TaxID=3069249 RepID=UPI002A420D7C|nr:NADH-quinone oxidoreductase subunit H [Trichloromonas sp.]
MIGKALLHLLLLFLLSPLLLGVIGKTKALFAGRWGAPLLQPYFDLWKLMRKGMVLSETTTWVFLAGPLIGFAVPPLAALFIPFGALTAPVSFTGDLILFVYLFGLSRFFTASAALDTGSSFEGMGAAREVTFSCLAEPTLLFVLIVLARLAGDLSLDAMLGPSLQPAWHQAGAALGLALVSLFVVLLVENSRIPFDDPNTHLELTMIHEVMVLDHSGPAFGLILYGAAMKLFVLGAVLMRMALPMTYPSPWLNLLVFVAGMLALAVVIGVVESIMARLRLIRIPQVLVGTTLLSAFAMVLLLR